MKSRLLSALAMTVFATSLAFAEDDNAIKQAMKFAHKAPKGEKKLNEKIAEGTAEEGDIKKALDLYKAMVDVKPPKGDQGEFQGQDAQAHHRHGRADRKEAGRGGALQSGGGLQRLPQRAQAEVSR